MLEQSNFELRWYKETPKSEPKLQYRVYYNSTIYALPAGIEKPTGMEKWKWSGWQSVLTYTEKY